MLRNAFGEVRSKVSHFFAWFGRIALEVFASFRKSKANTNCAALYL